MWTEGKCATRLSQPLWGKPWQVEQDSGPSRGTERLKSASISFALGPNALLQTGVDTSGCCSTALPYWIHKIKIKTLAAVSFKFWWSDVTPCHTYRARGLCFLPTKRAPWIQRNYFSWVLVSRLASTGALAKLKLEACWATSVMTLITSTIFRGGLPHQPITWLTGHLIY